MVSSKGQPSASGLLEEDVPGQDQRAPSSGPWRGAVPACSTNSGSARTFTSSSRAPAARDAERQHGADAGRVELELRHFGSSAFVSLVWTTSVKWPAGRRPARRPPGSRRCPRPRPRSTPGGRRRSSTGSAGIAIPGSAPSTPASNEPDPSGLAVLELGRGLAHVPDVALPILRVPVQGVLDERAVLGHRVADDPRGDAVREPLGLAGRGHDDAELARPPLDLVGSSSAWPGRIGQRRLSISVVNSAGSRFTGSEPWAGPRPRWLCPSRSARLSPSRIQPRRRPQPPEPRRGHRGVRIGQ